MWCVLDFDGNVLHEHPSWDAAVTWAMKHGGDMDIVFQMWGAGA